MERSRKLLFRTICISVVTIVSWSNYTLTSANTNTGELQNLFEQAYEYCHSEQFGEAIKLAQQIREKYPDEPAGAFSLLTTYQTINGNYRVRLYEKKVDSLLNLAIKLAQKAVKNNKKDGKNYFYLGTAYGFRSLSNVQNGEWVAAFRDGSKVMKNFNMAIAMDPDFYDSYYGLGLYKYWLNAKGAMRYLPNAGNNRNEGITYINMAIEKGRHTKVDAQYGLTAILVHEEEYEQALEICQSLYRDYPNNPNLNYRIAKIYCELNKPTEAIKYFDNLDILLKTTPYQSLSYQIECLFNLAKLHYNAEQYLKAQQYTDEAIALIPNCEFSKEKEGPYEEHSEIKESLYELRKNITTIKLSKITENQ